MVSDSHKSVDLFVFFFMVFFNICCPYSNCVLIIKLLPRFLLPTLYIMNQVFSYCNRRVSELINIILHFLKSFLLFLCQTNVSIIYQVQKWKLAYTVKNDIDHLCVKGRRQEEEKRSQPFFFFEISFLFLKRFLRLNCTLLSFCKSKIWRRE